VGGKEKVNDWLFLEPIEYFYTNRSECAADKSRERGNVEQEKTKKLYTFHSNTLRSSFFWYHQTQIPRKWEEEIRQVEGES